MRRIKLNTASHQLELETKHHKSKPNNIHVCHMVNPKK